jgi:hypothetical protein
MLSPKTQYNLKNAKEYFEEHLCVGDYSLSQRHERNKRSGKGSAGMLQKAIRRQNGNGRELEPAP